MGDRWNASTAFSCWLLVIGIVCIASVQSNACTFNFTGPRDVVIVIDISASVSANRFDAAKSVLEQLIMKVFQLEPNFTRLAVITFSGTFDTPVNSISGSNMYECEFFDPGSPWNTSVTFHDDTGADLLGTLREVSRLLAEGDTARPGVAQDVIITTDAHQLFSDTSEETLNDERRMINNTGATIYGMGVGVYMNESLFLDRIVNDPSCYRNHTEWTTIVGRLAERNYNVTSGEEWRRTVDQTLCIPACASSELCACYRNMTECALNDIVGTTDPPNESDDSLFDLLLKIFFGVCGVMLVVMLVALAMCLYRLGVSHARRKRNDAPPNMGLKMDDDNTRGRGMHNQYSTHSPDTQQLPPSPTGHRQTTPITEYDDLDFSEASTIPRNDIPLPSVPQEEYDYIDDIEGTHGDDYLHPMAADPPAYVNLKDLAEDNVGYINARS